VWGCVQLAFVSSQVAPSFISGNLSGAHFFFVIDVCTKVICRGMMFRVLLRELGYQVRSCLSLAGVVGVWATLEYLQMSN